MATAGPQQPQQPAQAYAQFPGAYGQPFQTYSQYGAPAGVPLPQPTQNIMRPEVPESKIWRITRSALHGAGIIVAIICIGLSFAFRGTYTEIYMTWCSTPPAFIAFVWSLAELIVRAVKKQKEGIHPGAHVGVCLIIWLAASLVAGIFAAFAVVSGYDDDWSTNCASRYYNYNTQEYSYSNCSVPFNGRYSQFLALVVFSWLLWLIYFVLFVGSCVDTHKRNQMKRQRVVIVNPGSFWGAGQGWQQLPQSAQAAPVATHDIPMQDRKSGEPQNPVPTEFYSEKGKEPQRVPPSHQPAAAAAPQITEYYTPSGGR